MSSRWSVVYIANKIHIYEELDYFAEGNCFTIDTFVKNSEGYSKEEIIEIANSISSFFDKRNADE